MRPILSIDFGTTNTYVSTMNDSGRMEEFPLEIGGGDNLHGITSAILYRTAGDKKGKNEYGQRAVEVYGGASPAKKEKNGLRFAAGFKPDITRSEEAREDAKNFLEMISQALADSRMKNKLSEMDVIFGVPCEADDQYQDTLKAIAREAGFGEISLLPEPFGALCYHCEKDLEKIKKYFHEKRVLVVDFGGGTCDFTLLQKGEIKNHWGDMNLGGRLFDDLFYQWMRDMALNNEEMSKSDFYYLTAVCRQEKEKFSNSMRDDRSGAHEVYIPGICQGEMTWSEFEKRVQNYTPSQTFLKYFRTRTDGKTDLVKWFKDSLRKGFEEKNIGFSSIDLVILAGGSSQWYFVDDYCQELFGNEKIQRSLNVYAAVSEGLGKYKLIKEELESNVKQIQNEKNQFLEECCEKLVSILLLREEKDLERIVDFGKEVFDEFIRPELVNFQKKGGKIQDIENSIMKKVSDNQNMIVDKIRVLLDKKNEEINKFLQIKVADWLHVQPESLTIGQNEIKFQKLYESNEKLSTGIAEDISGWLAGAIAAILAGIIIASSSIGGPPAWAGAAVISFGVKMVAPALIKPVAWSSSWAAWLMTDSKIQEICDAKFCPVFKNRFLDVYAKIIEPVLPEIESYVTGIVNTEIERHSKIIEIEK